MKKLLAALTLALLCAACSSADTPAPVNDPASDAQETEEALKAVPAQENFSLTVSGARLTLGAAADIEKLLGKADDKAEAPSCIHEGNDILYVYPDVEIVTSPSPQGQYISSITILSDALATEEGIRLGDAVSSALTAYGTVESSFGRYQFVRGASTLTVMTDDAGKITSMSYAFEE